jgi:threonine/homoserine/homoserine lactone efflux protein
MPALESLLLFAVSTLAILVVPGPSVMFVVARTLEHGRAAGLVSMAGVETGALIHVAIASAGLSAIVASAPGAITALRWLGAAYLLCLAAGALRRHRPGGPPPAPVPRRRLFREGLLVDLLNPKTALFFLAFLPGFVDPAQGPAGTQIAVLGLCFVALAALTDGAYALAAARLGRRAVGGRGLARASGATYAALGMFTIAGG